MDSGWDQGPDQTQPRRPNGREALRLVLPSFAVTAVCAVVGLVLIVLHHRAIGVVILVIGAVGGFLFRMRLMWRHQQGGGRPR
jgi:uncharacterized membrane protein